MKNIQIAQKIKNLCKLKNISISKLTYDCNISKSIIYDLEKRDSSPSSSTTIKIAQYFNVSTDYLLGLTDITTPANNQLSVDKEDIFLVSPAEQELIKKYRPLDENGRATVDGLVDMLYKQQCYTTVPMVARGGNQTNTFLTADLDALLIDKPDEYDDI